MNPGRLRILKLHKQWADRYLLIWLVFALALLSGFEFFLELTGIGAAQRAGVVALLGLLILLSAIWQAIGLAVARVQLRGCSCKGAHDHCRHRFREMNHIVLRVSRGTRGTFLSS